MSAVWQGVSLLQLNVEVLTKAKINIIEHLVKTHNVTVVLLQETHQEHNSRLKIPGYILAANTGSKIHSMAVFVKNSASWRSIASCPPASAVEWTAVEMESVTVINVYKPPQIKLRCKTYPVLANPAYMLATLTATDNMGISLDQPRWHYT